MPIARVLLRLGALALALASSGCFTTWATAQAFGSTSAFDENARDERVPLPGVREWLAVGLVPDDGLGLDTGERSYSLGTDSAPSASGGRQVVREKGAPRVVCVVGQTGRTRHHRAAHRYGSRWKLVTGLTFLVEGAVGTAYLLGTGDGNLGKKVAGGFLAIDAVGTAALFFVPRKSIYVTREEDERLPLRGDCPDGVTLVVRDRAIPVDAAGLLPAWGKDLIVEHLLDGGRDVVVQAADRTSVLTVTPALACDLARTKSDPRSAAICQARGFGVPPPSETVIEVPPGTYTAGP